MGQIINVISVFTLGFCLNLMVIPRILSISFKKKLFDSVDERKVHQGIIPRLGGVSFFPNILFTFGLGVAVQSLIWLDYKTDNVTELLFACCSLVVLFLIGITDDLIGVNYKKKFLIQIFCAILLVSSGLRIDNFYGLFGINQIAISVSIPFTILFIVFMINSINLIDGIDGLASGISGIAFLTFGILFLILKEVTYSMLSFSALGVIVSFFCYNVFGKIEKGNKIFMGDTGALTIGYILSLLTIKLCTFHEELSGVIDRSIVFAFSPLLIPMLDSIRVFAYRLLIKKHPFKPDKNHIHHKFLAIGFSQRKTMISILIISCFFISINMTLINYYDINIVLIVDIAFWTYLNLLLNRRIKLIEKNNNICFTQPKYMKHKSQFMIKKIPIYLILIFSTTSCNTSKKIVYFQNATLNEFEKIEKESIITIQPKDKLSIVVSSKDPQLSALFNLPVISYQLGRANLSSDVNNIISGFTVDKEGYIDYPILGKIKVGGLTREQATVLIKNKIISEDLIKDPVVTIDFMNLYLSILGEVNTPGRYSIERDQITILEAISLAGDLTIQGKRDDILVLREEYDTRITYSADFRNLQELQNSPVYYLQQNDIVYVQPNKVKAGQSTVNENNVRSVSLWVSVASLLTTLGILIFK